MTSENSEGRLPHRNFVQIRCRSDGMIAQLLRIVHSADGLVLDQMRMVGY